MLRTFATSELSSIIVIPFLILLLNTASSHIQWRSWEPLGNNAHRRALSKIIVSECNTNRHLMYQIHNTSNPFARFEDDFSVSAYPPTVSIQHYLSQIYHKLHFGKKQISDGIFVIVGIYMNRVMQRSRVKITYWNVHRILSMSTWMACKMHYDVEFNLFSSVPFAFALDVQGIDSLHDGSTINDSHSNETYSAFTIMEYGFLIAIDFKLFVCNLEVW